MGGEKGLIAPHFAFERTGGLSGNDFWDVFWNGREMLGGVLGGVLGGYFSSPKTGI